MAFAGLIWGSAIFIVIIIIYAMLGLSLLIFTILGFVFRKKHSVASIIMFSVAGVSLAVIVFLTVGYDTSPKSITEYTQDGSKVEIQTEDWSKMNSAFKSYNPQTIINLLNEKSERIYFYDYYGVNVIDYGLFNMNVDIMKCALEHGAVFDDPVTAHKKRVYQYASLDAFYRELYYPDATNSPWYEEGAVTDEMIEAVRFALENGAMVDFHESYRTPADSSSSQNFYEQTWIWVNSDNELSDKDWELLDLVESYMPDGWSVDDMYDSSRGWYGQDITPDAREYKRQ